MNQEERMQKNLPYKCWMDGLPEKYLKCQKLLSKYNRISPYKRSKRTKLLKKIIGKTGDFIEITPPFHCDYGFNIETGEGFYANFNLTILDCGKVTMGKFVALGPNVSIYTAGHPVHPVSRNSGYEYGIDISIGDNTWIGGNCCILPGVKIGKNVVVGAGSVVTKDIPDDVIAAGNPCRVIRKITDDDKKFYFKDREFDVADYDKCPLIDDTSGQISSTEKAFF